MCVEQPVRPVFSRLSVSCDYASSERKWLQVIPQVLQETRISLVTIISKFHLNNFLFKSTFYLLIQFFSFIGDRVQFLNNKYSNAERSFVKLQANGTSSDHKWKRRTTLGTKSYNEWQQVTKNGKKSDNEWCNNWRRLTMSGTANGN